MTVPGDTGGRIRIDVLLRPAQDEEILEELRATLGEEPPRIPTKLLYDRKGSLLYEEITRLPEYYPARTEQAILDEVGPHLAVEAPAEEIVELGAGSAEKTRALLRAYAEAGSLRTYVPFDVSEVTMRRVAEELVAEFPGLTVHGVVADFVGQLEGIPAGGRRLVLFLGGTIGNLGRVETAAALLRDLRLQLGPEDRFLLGVDRIKDVARLEAAYNDGRGVTAAFNLNALSVANRLTGGNFDPAGWRHRAFYDPEKAWIEMRLVSTRDQTVRLPRIGFERSFRRGEEILTEVSAKYDGPRVERLFALSGFELLEWFTDPEELFALVLARPA